MGERQIPPLDHSFPWIKVCFVCLHVLGRLSKVIHTIQKLHAQQWQLRPSKWVSEWVPEIKVGRIFRKKSTWVVRRTLALGKSTSASIYNPRWAHTQLRNRKHLNHISLCVYWSWDNIFLEGGKPLDAQKKEKKKGVFTLPSHMKAWFLSLDLQQQN